MNKKIKENRSHEETKDKKGFFDGLGGLAWWNIKDENLRNQVENYDSLKITKSYRGISSLLVIGSICLSILLIAVGWLEISLFVPLIYLPLAFFILKGRRWAIVTMMVLWTFDKAYSLLSGYSNNPVMSIAWWITFMSPLYRAFKVEQFRNK